LIDVYDAPKCRFAQLEKTGLKLRRQCDKTDNQGRDLRSRVSLTKSENHFAGVQNTIAPFKKELIDALAEIQYLVIKINMVISKTPRYSEGVELATIQKAEGSSIFRSQNSLLKKE